MAVVDHREAPTRGTRPMAGQNALEVRDLRMRYGTKDVLTGVDPLNVGVRYLGPSG